MCISEFGGGYITTLETDLRLYSTASLRLPYMNTTNKCLRFFYRFYGNGETELKVHIYAPNRVISVQRISRSGTQSPRWEGVYERLPAGAHRMNIDANRNGEGVTGLGLDDLEIADCSAFEGVVK